MIVHEDLGVQLRLNPELVMRKTAFNESANAVARMYQDKRKKDQVLISINCSKASMPGKKSHQDDQNSLSGIQEKSSYDLDQIVQTKNSKTPNPTRGKEYKADSQYHQSCKDGTSILLSHTSNKYRGFHMPNINNKMN